MGASFPVHLPNTTPRAGLGSGSSQQLRQLGDVGGDAPGLVAGEEFARRAVRRLVKKRHPPSRYGCSQNEKAARVD
jgi:hypothetical protein